MGVLTIHLDKIENLRDSDGVGKSDPYVILKLVKDKRFLDKSFGEKKSKTIKDECSPVFNEDFVFDGLPDDISDLELRVQVYDDDFGKDDMMGEATIVIKNYSLSGSPTDISVVVDSRGLVFKKKATMYIKASFTA